MLTIHTMAKAFYTTAEAAEELGVAASRVRQLVLDGTIAAEKHGRDLMILPEAIEQAKLRKTKPGPKKQTTDGEVSTAADAPDDAMPPAVAGKKPAKKAARKK
jgi:excisionase family DNA binding protein